MICLWGLEQRHAGAIFTGAIFMLQSWSLESSISPLSSPS